jgi:predicted DNA-binding transcriptional regulator AlpA
MLSMADIPNQQECLTMQPNDQTPIAATAAQVENRATRGKAALMAGASFPAQHNPAELPLDAETAAPVAGLSLGAFWRAVAAGRMPAPVYPMPRAPRWYASEIRHAMEQTRCLPRNQAAARRLARMNSAA